MHLENRNKRIVLFKLQFWNMFRLVRIPGKCWYEIYDDFTIAPLWWKSSPVKDSINKITFRCIHRYDYINEFIPMNSFSLYKHKRDAGVDRDGQNELGHISENGVFYW